MGDQSKLFPNNVEEVMMELEVPRGRVPGMRSVNKYGRAIDGIQVTATDIWDLANAAATQQIWLAPTAARIHQIKSTSVEDDGTPEGAGSGAQAVRIWGLKTWDSKESSEDVILNGTANVATANSYVIIHRMKVIPVGSTYAINAGGISATADTDSTVTAYINIGQGQTLMAIYGIGSVETAFICCYQINAHNTANPSTPMEADFTLLINERPDLDTTVFLNKANGGLISTGTSDITRHYRPMMKVEGPAILKFQALSTLADTEGVAEFDVIIKS